MIFCFVWVRIVLSVFVNWLVFFFFVMKVKKNWFSFSCFIVGKYYCFFICLIVNGSLIGLWLILICWIFFFKMVNVCCMFSVCVVCCVCWRRVVVVFLIVVIKFKFLIWKVIVVCLFNFFVVISWYDVFFFIWVSNFVLSFWVLVLVILVFIFFKLLKNCFWNCWWFVCKCFVKIFGLWKVWENVFGFFW